jgi:hypothetical protein
MNPRAKIMRRMNPAMDCFFGAGRFFSANADKEHRYTNADLKHRDANIFNSGVKPHSWGAGL